MSPFNEFQLTRRVLELREACPETGDFATRLHDELRISTEESTALAAALEDRFLSLSEQTDLLGRLDLHGVLTADSRPAAFLSRLAGVDGREAFRHRARHLASSLVADPRPSERTPLDAETFRELAALLPRGIGSAGLGGPFSSGMGVGIYHYLRPEDSFLSSLAEELRGNLESSPDPILRMRSARVLAEAGDRDAAAFLRESEAGLARSYSGELSLEERLARACGLAVDGDSAAIRFLQNIAMDPRANTERRACALAYLSADSLENGSDAGEVFRSMAEDPEEPVATRYLMLSLLARASHPPEPAWWRGLLSDVSMIVEDHRYRSSEVTEETADFSQWNILLAALSESPAPWSADLLLEAMENGSLPAAQRREALMAYLRHEGRGTLPWDSVRNVLLAQSGWGALLSDVEGRETELRLRFPERPETEPGVVFDIRGLNSIGKEVVLHLREGTTGGWMVDFRPLDPQHDELSSRPVLTEAEERFPLNRRIFLDAMGLDREWDGSLPEAEVAVTETAPYDPEPGTATPGASAAPTRLAVNEPQRPLPAGPNHVQQQNSNGGSSGAFSGAGAATPPSRGI